MEKGDKSIFSKIRFSLSRQRSTLTECMLAATLYYRRDFNVVNLELHDYVMRSREI